MVPENFYDQSSNLVVLDLGRLHLYNKTMDVAATSPTEDENDG
jgi:hypothetical protein